MSDFSDQMGCAWSTEMRRQDDAVAEEQWRIAQARRDQISEELRLQCLQHAEREQRAIDRVRKQFVAAFGTRQKFEQILSGMVKLDPPFLKTNVSQWKGKGLAYISVTNPLNCGELASVAEKVFNCANPPLPEPYDTIYRFHSIVETQEAQEGANVVFVNECNPDLPPKIRICFIATPMSHLGMTALALMKTAVVISRDKQMFYKNAMEGRKIQAQGFRAEYGMWTEENCMRVIVRMPGYAGVPSICWPTQLEDNWPTVFDSGNTCYFEPFCYWYEGDMHEYEGAFMVTSNVLHLKWKSLHRHMPHLLMTFIPTFDSDIGPSQSN